MGWPQAPLCAVALCLSMPALRADPAPSSQPVQDLDAERKARDDAAAAAAAAAARQKATEADLEAIRADRARLSTALIDTSAKVRAAEDGVAEAEKRLDLLLGSQQATEAALVARRGEIAEVLAALERIGRRPMPAILASPDDILAAIRASMLLGAVVPDLRDKAEALASDLAELKRLREGIATERDRLAGERVALRTERTRLEALVDARQAAQRQAEGALADETRRSAELARQAAGLSDLVGRLEDDAAAARRAADAARAADDARRKAAEDEARTVGDRASAAGEREAPHLAPAVAFTEVKGRMPLPVAGNVIKSFGDSDSYGGAERGVSVAALAGAVVTTPVDATIVFAGPYRSYGQLLILDGGGGYYIVLAGMERASVVAGQFVLAGEPVGTMGNGSARTATAIALGAARPVLYIEFRKDGAPIDPSPWWAKAGVEKVRG